MRVYQSTMNISLKSKVYENISIIRQLKENNVSSALDVKLHMNITQENVMYLYEVIENVLMKNRYIDKHNKVHLNSLYLFMKNKGKEISKTISLRGYVEDETYISILKELKDKPYIQLTNDLVITYDRLGVKHIKKMIDELSIEGVIANIGEHNKKLDDFIKQLRLY